jgi:hypothetical protein
MSRASSLAGFSTSISPPSNLSVGVITAVSFVGNGSGLTGVANTDFIVSTAITSQTLNVTSSAIIENLTVNGTQTIINTNILDVADKNIGIASTATKLSDAALDGAGITIYGSDSDKTLTWDNSNSRMAFSTNLYVPVYYGDGSQLDGISAGGIGTESTSGGLITLDLTAAQDHKVTATGITTITVSGGLEGDSHTVRIVNSGIATVGFSTYFLFPSGSVPSLPTADGTINLISFTVHRVGAAGTQLLAGAGLNYQ